jgi:2-oxoglutarate-Fe(II)-dependent oxygenase superfamily protein
MSAPSFSAASTHPFPYSRWKPLMRQLASEYQAAAPFPHIHLDGFLEAETAKRVASEFPDVHSTAWIHYKHANEKKSGLNKRELFPPCIGEVVDELNSQSFVTWLSELTGIPDLLPDPSLEGGGLHQAGRGGFLNVHSDFSVHHYRPKWRRRVNLIVYLNPDWQEQWGGALEFWEKGMKRRAVAYAPLLNHAIIFNTDQNSLHGFPDPLRCPEGLSRKSLALYYYTAQESSMSIVRSTDYRPRPADSILKASIIRLDTLVLNLYSKAKRHLGFSDRLASRLLNFISGRKRPTQP